MTLRAARTIEIQDWMTDAKTRRVMDALREDSTAPQALFVGGCVRNALLGLPVRDIDIATVHTPDQTIACLQKAGIKFVPTGIDHGTVMAVADGTPFEITTLRRDVATDGRHAVVAFTDDWHQDASRRDFTMNTLLADADGHIYDPTGLGLGDLDARRVVFVGDPVQRIDEDILRILRFFRFHAFYGDGEPDAAALAACAAAAGKIPTLSRERITQEILKIVMAPAPATVVRQMRDAGIMTDLFHPDMDLNALGALAGLQGRTGLPMAESRLSLIGGADPGHMPVFEKYLAFSSQQKKTLDLLASAVRSPTTIRERLYHYGRDVGGQSLLMLAAMADAVIGNDEIEIIRDWPIPVLPVSGEDLKKLGVAEGPSIGEFLKTIEEWWVEWDFQPDRAQCLERAQALVAQV